MTFELVIKKINQFFRQAKTWVSRHHWLSLSIGLILLINLVTKFYQLGNLPQAFFGDEAALGYNAWSLLTTGRDEYGQPWPITLRSFDDDKPAVYAYLTIPAVASFGISQFSARLPAAVFGFLLPLVMAWFIVRLSKSQLLAVLVALVIVVTPWHWEISRTAIEAGVALTLTISAMALFASRQRWLVLIAGLLGLAVLFTYHTARIIAPLLLVSMLVLKLVKATKLRWAVALSILLLGLGLSLFSSQSRFQQISLFNDQGLRLVRAESIREDGGPIKVPLWLTRVYHNKFWSVGLGFAQSYLTNTSLSYLFIGGAQPPRVTIPQTGQFLLVLLPFFILGLSASWRRWQVVDRWLLFWLLLAPIPASFTTAEIPHTYRTLFLLPVVAFYIGLGLLTAFNWLKRCYQVWLIPAILITSLALSYSAAKAWHQYRVHQQLHQPWYRQYGYQDLITYLNSLEGAEQITITNRENEPYIFILFYNQIHPADYQAWPEKRLGHQEIDQGARTWKLFNYVFSEDACPHQPQDSNPNNYYVVHFTCELPQGYQRVKTINFLDGNPEFFIDRPISFFN